MAVRIGIAATYQREGGRVSLPELYLRALLDAGGVPVILPNSHEVDLKLQLEGVHGLLLPGGEDVDPKYFQENPHPNLGVVDPDWDQSDLALAEYALGEDLPVLGICRGAQILNVAAGGSLFQDIPSQLPQAIGHRQRPPYFYPIHLVKVVYRGLLLDSLGVEELRVNSTHHQAVKDLGRGFVIAAQAPDGVIEAIESTQHRFALGVQWHPEHLVIRDPSALGLFRALIAAAERRCTDG